MNSLLNLSLRIFSFHNSDSDFLVGGLSTGGKKAPPPMTPANKPIFLRNSLRSTMFSSSMPENPNVQFGVIDP